MNPATLFKPRLSSILSYDRPHLCPKKLSKITDWQGIYFSLCHQPATVFGLSQAQVWPGHWPTPGTELILYRNCHKGALTFYKGSHSPLPIWPGPGPSLWPMVDAGFRICNGLQQHCLHKFQRDTFYIYSCSQPPGDSIKTERERLSYALYSAVYTSISGQQNLSHTRDISYWKV